MSERWRIEPDYAIKVDSSLGLLGVLLEPTSVVTKAWEAVAAAGSRSFWEPRTVLVTGAGPIGLLAALLGKQRGLDVHVLDQVELGPKPDLVRALGATYHSGTMEGTWIRARQCGVFILPLSCWDQVNADSILVDTSDCQHHRPLPRKRASAMNICPPCKKPVHSRSVEGAAGSMRLYCFMGLASLIAVRPGELASDRGKARFRQTPPTTIDRYNRSKLFFAWDGDPSILRSFRLSYGFEPYPHVINSIMQEQEAYPN